MVNQVISLAGLMDSFKGDRNTIEKGEIKYNADFVLECKIVDLTVQGCVRASMKGKSYKVGLVVNGEGYIMSASCQCPIEEWICSHMAATATYTNRKGFQIQICLIPGFLDHRQERKRLISLHSIGDKPEYRAACRAFTDEDCQTFYTDRQKLNTICSLNWISSPELEKIEDPIVPPLVEDLLPLLFKDKNGFIQKIKITKEQKLFFSETTKTQRKCQLWGNLDG